MKRRTFITGTTISLVPLAGCVGGDSSGSESSPTGNGSAEPTSTETTQTTTESQTIQTETVTESPTTRTETVTEPTVSTQEPKGACNNVTYVGFFSLNSASPTNNWWGSSKVSVGLSLGAGADVYLVALENDTILGKTQIEAPNDGAVVVDGQKIPLNTELSGEHTIRVVAYPNTGEADQFNAEQATPCHHEGEPVQTEPTTIDFNRFSKDTDTGTDTTSVTKQDNSTSATQTIGSCPLMHEVDAITTPISPTGSSMEFEKLSPEAKEIFEKARNQDEILFIYDESKKPPEFGYTDERKSHTIVKDGEKYQLFAYTNAGCSFPAETES